MKRALIYGLSLAGVLLASCGEEKKAAAASGKAGEVALRSTSNDVKEVIAIGYGDDHAAAMADACTQAVSQVCGAGVMKAVLAARGKSLELGATMYEGILLSYTVLEDIKAKDGSFQIKIKAQVKPPASDMFKDRVGVLVPSVQNLGLAFSKGDWSSGTAEIVAETVGTTVLDVVSADERLVVLDRQSGIAEAERALAASGRTARTENAKSGSMKAADFVFDISLESGKENISVQEFKVAKRNKYTFSLEVELIVRLVDVASGGVVAMERVSLKRNGFTWNQSECAGLLRSGLEEECRMSLKNKLTSLLSRIGVN